MMPEREQDAARRLDQDLAWALASRNRDPRDSGSKVGSETAGLVYLAARLRAELAPPEPPASFVWTGRVRLENRLRARPAADRRTARRPAPRRWGFARRLAFTCLSLALALSVGSAGIAYAAQDSLPGDGLYGVKIGIESARLALASAPDARVRLLTEFADQRIAEASALINSNREADLGRALDEYQAEIDELQILIGDLPAADRSAVLAEIQAHLQQHIEVLETVRDRAPAAAQPALDKAIQASSHSQDVIQQIEQGNPPSEVAPGQMKKPTPEPPEPSEVPPGQIKKPTPEPGDNNPHGPPATPPGKSKH